MNKIIPKKKFGQNFLIDLNILRKIINLIDITPNDSIIEIGPGLGALTEHIIGKCKFYCGVEIDKRAVEALKEKYSNINIIHGDFLKSDLQELASYSREKLRIIGNIPYNITSPILFKLINDRKFIKDSIIMTQLEVAQRMTAKIGTKDYGILAVTLGLFCKTKLCFKISPNAFYPKPKVQSAIVKIEFNDLSRLCSIDYGVFIQVVKASFGNRRKILKNSLNNSIFAKYNFSDCTIDLTRRAEQLSVSDFIKLTQYIQSKIDV